MAMRSRRAISLVEVLMILVVVGLVIALLPMGLGKAHRTARRSTCNNNQHTLALAMAQYESVGRPYPGFRNRMLTDNNQMTICSWVPPLFPYLERNDLVELWKTQQNPPNTFLRFLACPSNPPAQTDGKSPTAYVVNSGVGQNLTVGANWVVGPIVPSNTQRHACDGVFHDFGLEESDPDYAKVAIPVTAKYVNEHDGTTYTLLLGEYAPISGQLEPLWHEPGWSVPEERVAFQWNQSGTSDLANRVNKSITSKHGGVSVVSFCDGHQISLHEDIDYLTFMHLCTPDSAEAAKVHPSSGIGDSKLDEENF